MMPQDNGEDVFRRFVDHERFDRPHGACFLWHNANIGTVSLGRVNYPIWPSFRVLRRDDLRCDGCLAQEDRVSVSVISVDSTDLPRQDLLVDDVRPIDV
ncbi:hypothetical protein MUY22_31585 [Amycolatopsis sp. WQ 127309]|nr:hypothetical protein [Amycolatopsis sp. WQ 127309]UOZ03385.1 hypothetical protein MUY22_31585 [Amycolatopsis sp. WQ 127309]